MSDKKTVIALGYFDSVHIGHQSVMRKAGELAKKTNSRLAVFTFGGNLKATLLNSEEKCVYTPAERECIIKEMGVDEVYFAPVTKEFLSLDKKRFLDFINERFDISCYVSGEDYRFGHNGLGDKLFLAEYANARNQQYLVCQTESYGGEKISTTRIKDCLAKGQMKQASKMLGRAYSITGKVFEDRKIGRKIGFPTVNLAIEKDKFNLLGGVYKGRVELDGKEYNAVINYGARPTYDLTGKLIEAHIVDFNGDLYGRELTVKFDAFMRDIVKFNSEAELICQLKKDLQGVKEGRYD